MVKLWMIGMNRAGQHERVIRRAARLEIIIFESILTLNDKFCHNTVENIFNFCIAVRDDTRHAITLSSQHLKGLRTSVHGFLASKSPLASPNVP